MELALLDELVRPAAAQSEQAPVAEYEAVVRVVWLPQQAEMPFRWAQRAHADALQELRVRLFSAQEERGWQREAQEFQ
jgi:hypothetical protein